VQGLEPGDLRRGPAGADFDPTMAAVRGDCRRGDFGLLVLEVEFDVFEQGLLIALKCQQVVGLLVENGLRGLPLTVRRIRGDQAAAHVDQRDELADRRDLIGLLRDVELTDDGAIQARIGVEHGHRRGPVGVLDGTAQNLAVDGHQIDAVETTVAEFVGEMIVEGDQRLLERRRPDHRQDLVKLGQREQTVLERQKLLQPVEMVFQEEVDLRYPVAARNDGQKTQGHDFGQIVHGPVTSPWIIDRLEYRQERARHGHHLLLR
jgi:hypothetical protein